VSAPLQRLLGTIDGQRRRLVLAGVLGALALGSSVGLMAASAYLISRAALQPPILALQVAIVGVRAFGIGRAVFRYAERLVGHDAAFRGLAALRVQIYTRLERIAPAGLAQWRRGDLLVRLVDDVDAALDLQLRVVLPFLAALLVGAGSVVFAWLLLPAAGVILLVAMLLGGIAVPAVTAAAGRYAERDVAPTRARVATEVVATMETAADLMALQATDRAVAALAAADQDLTRLARRSSLVLGIGAGLGTLTQGLAVAGSLLVGAAAVGDGRLSGVLLAVVVLLPLAAYEAMLTLPAAVLTLARVRTSADRVFDIVDAPPPCPDPPAPQPLPQSPPTVAARGLTVSWPGAAAAAVADLDLDWSQGQRIAVVGASGSGKTSLAMALLRFLPYSGSLTLNGLPLDALLGDDVRSAIGVLAQDAHLFDTTIEENLRLARPEAAEDELWQALRRAGVAGWVADLPDGLGSRVGAHGSRISGGQRQRLALARVLLAEQPLVILDEPTEHLDPVEGDQVLADALDALRGRGVLLITHHLRHVLHCDEVVVMAQGRVVDRGDPGAARHAGGAFAALVAEG
jgi:thiol reductant ABC exporter CydC subunit